MAAIKEETYAKGQKVRLTSSEFPNLQVEGDVKNKVSLRKRLNALMRERRRKSGSVDKKMSPSGKKKVKTRDIEDVPTTKIGAQGDEPTGHSSKTMPSPVETEKKTKPEYKGYKTDLEMIAKGGKKKKKGPAKMDSTYGPDSGDQSLKEIVKEGIQEAGRDSQPGAVKLDSKIPPKPKSDDTRGLSNLPHIRKRQLAERKRKEKSKTSSLASNIIQGKRKETHPLKRAEERRKMLKQSSDSFPDLVKADKDAGKGKSSRKELVERVKMMLTRGQLDPNSPEVRRILGPENLPEHLKNKRTSDYHSRHRRTTRREEYVDKVKKMIAEGKLDRNDPEAIRILGKEDQSPNVGPDKELEQKPVAKEKLAELDAIDKKLKAQTGFREGDTTPGTGTDAEGSDQGDDAGGLMKMPESPQKGEVSEEPVKYDENGYPIYAKGSKKAAEWNKAYADAKPGKFWWDGREYTKEGNPEEDEKAAVATQDSMTGDARVAEELGVPEHPDSEAQESQAFQQSDAQAQENSKIADEIVKIKDDPSINPHDSEKAIKDKVRHLSKEDTADAKEQAGDWYVDPWTGFAIDLNKLQARQDRKDAMEFAALLPADQRAAYLSQEGLIDPEDLEKLLEPSELEQLQLQTAEIALKTASFNLVQAKLKSKDYKTDEEIADIELKKTIAAEKRKEQADIRKYEREKTPVSNKAEMDRYAGLYKNAITNDDFAGQVYWGEKMNLPRAEMVRIAKSRAAWEVKMEKNKDGVSAFKEIFEIPYKSVVDSRSKLLMGTASLWTTGSIDIQIGNKQVKSREGLLNTLGIEDYEDMTAEDENGNPLLQPEEVIRMISSQSDLSIFRNPDYQNEDGSPDFMSILEDEDVYKQFVLNNAIYKGMNALHGGEYADILTYEAKRRQKRHRENKIFKKKVTTNQG